MSQFNSIRLAPAKGTSLLAVTFYCTTTSVVISIIVSSALEGDDHNFLVRITLCVTSDWCAWQYFVVPSIAVIVTLLLLITSVFIMRPSTNQAAHVHIVMFHTMIVPGDRFGCRI